MYNTQCVCTSMHIGDIHCVTFFGDSYTHWVTVYTLGCMLVFVTFCYPMYMPYVHWGTRIYIGTQVCTFTDMNVHWVHTLCYNDNKHVHWVTLSTCITRPDLHPVDLILARTVNIDPHPADVHRVDHKKFDTLQTITV